MHEGSCIFSACFSAESDRTNGGTGVLRVIFAERDTGQDCQVQREAASGYTKNCNNFSCTLLCMTCNSLVVFVNML